MGKYDHLLYDIKAAGKNIKRGRGARGLQIWVGKCMEFYTPLAYHAISMR